MVEETKPAETEAPSEAPDAVAPGRPRLLSKIELAGFLAAVVIAQCLLAWFLIPSSSETAHAGQPESAELEHELEHAEKDADHLEVDMGKFSLTSFDPHSNRTLLIDFHLYGTILARDGESEDGEEAEAGHGAAPKEAWSPHSKFGHVYTKNKHRIRDQVIVTIRNADMSDLADPTLGLIKRQLLAKTNALLGEPILKEVVFSDFAAVEQ